MPSLFHNRFPDELDLELAAARIVQAVPVVVPSEAFVSLSRRGERLIYAVVEGVLLVSEPTVLLQRITHAALAEGRPVRAAGEVELIAEPDYMVVLELNNRSGHYLPDGTSLHVARAAFEEHGFSVSDDSLVPYNQEDP